MTGFILGLALLTYCALLYWAIGQGKAVNPGGLFWLVLIAALLATSFFEAVQLALRALVRA